MELHHPNAQFYQALTDFRPFLELCWRWTHHVHYDRSLQRSDPRPEIPSTFMCRHTSRLLLELLSEVDPGWSLAGGSIIQPDGKPQPHWWIEKDGIIVDLTSDQFGWESVVLTSTQDDRYKSTPHAASTSWIKSLTTALKQWYGEPSRDWMADDTSFQQLRRLSRPAMEAFQIQWKEALAPAWVASPTP